MDPFSIIASSVSTADVAYRLGRFITKTIKGARTVDSDLISLLDQVNDLSRINNGIKAITGAPDFQETLLESFEHAGSQKEQWKQLWHETEVGLQDTQKYLERLEKLIIYIQGNEGIASQADMDAKANNDRPGADVHRDTGSGTHHGTLRRAVASMRTEVRRDNKAAELGEIRQRLTMSQNVLGECLSMITLWWNMKSHKDTIEFLRQFKAELGSSVAEICRMMASFRAVSLTKVELPNRIFQAPAASDLFTGQDALLDHVEDAFGLVSHATIENFEKISLSAGTYLPLESPWKQSLSIDLEKSPPAYSKSSDTFTETRPKQKRFVLTGIGGSGKTEFCRKFAERNQSRFWAVFWIDASSEETVEHSYKTISRFGNVDENVRAAMTWLAGLLYPWLLVIDNADDEKLQLEKYLPAGDRGHVLITSRIPSLKHFGNVGYRFQELGELAEVEARDLLLKHAQEETPWGDVARSTAKRITEVLGYLPLALVYAGKAIAEGVTTLDEYISWFDESWRKIRLAGKTSGRKVDERNKNVFAPYEAMVCDLEEEETESSQDSIDLLKLFSFVHHEGISIEMLTNGAKNPPSRENKMRDEASLKEQQKTIEGGGILLTRPKPWRRKVKDFIIQWIIWYEGQVQYPMLPAVLRDDKGSHFDVHRLNLALSRLTQKSLVIERRQNGVKIFSMHPLIHKWVRERPRMRISEKALWCQAAVTILNQCIPLPPFGDEKAAVLFRRQLLPHLDATRSRQEEIQGEIEESRRARLLPNLFLTDLLAMDRPKAQQYARYSRLYGEAGRFDDARVLQEQVKEFAFRMLGAQDDRTILIMIALAGTYAVLTRFNDAVELLAQALEISFATLGPDHPRTLKVMDSLGNIECVRGRFKEARKLHEDALEGMQKVLPPKHADIFRSMDGLGAVWHNYFNYDKAEKLQSEAFEGLRDTLGKEHPDTLVAQENLAMTYLEMSVDFGQEIQTEQTLEKNVESLQKAYDLQKEVVATRREKLGQEHNWTLWGILHLARIKASLGYFPEAEKDMRAALIVGVRNLGEDHLGVLAGKTHLARVLVAQRKFPEAETVFQDVIDKSAYQQGMRAEGETPDHLLAVWYYAGCCQLNGKVNRAIELLEGISKGLVAIGATKHAFWQRVGNKLEELRQLREVRSDAPNEEQKKVAQNLAEG